MKVVLSPLFNLDWDFGIGARSQREQKFLSAETPKPLVSKRGMTHPRLQRTSSGHPFVCCVPEVSLLLVGAVGRGEEERDWSHPSRSIRTALSKQSLGRGVIECYRIGAKGS